MLRAYQRFARPEGLGMLFFGACIFLVSAAFASESPPAWTPELPDGATPLFEFIDQTAPITVDRGSQKAPSGGVFGEFAADGLGTDQVILKSFPLDLRIDAIGRMIVEDTKRGGALVHPGPVLAGVTHQYQVECTPEQWVLTLDGTRETFGAGDHPVCFSETWGDITIGAAGSGGDRRFTGSIDLVLYTGGNIDSDDDDDDDDSLTGDRVVFLAESYLTEPRSYPDGNWEAPLGSGGLEMIYTPDALGTRVVLFHAWPLLVELTASGDVQVHWNKSSRPLHMALAATPRVGQKLDAHWRCEGSKWQLEVDGQTTEIDAGSIAPCVADTRGRPVVAGSTKDGSHAIRGSLSFTWYADSEGDSDGGDGSSDEVVFLGDFETGDISQWPIQAYRESNPYAVQVLSPGRNGNYACRFEVRYLDRGYDEDGNPKKVRAELGDPSVAMGSTWWYGWSSRIDPSYTSEGRTFYMIQQWHQVARLPPFGQYYEHGVWKIYRNASIEGENGIILWQEAIPTGQWVDWVYHVKWSYENDGFLKAYKDGELVVDFSGPTAVETRKGPWFKFGMYRGAVDTGTQVVWHDEYRRGTSRNAVDPRNY